MTRFILTLLTTLTIIPQPLLAQSNQTKSTENSFRGGLEKGCKKKMSAAICKCYASKVTTRYSNLQLVAIYKQMEISKEARKMFFLANSPEMASCVRANKNSQ